MKHCIEFDLDNELDKIRFQLNLNTMYILDNISEHLFELDSILESEKPDLQTIKHLYEHTNHMLKEALDAFDYLEADGVCDACRAEAEAQNESGELN